MTRRLMATRRIPRAGTEKLTPRQARFVDEYMRDLNATQAAIRAGYSPRSAHAEGSATLNQPSVRDAIERAKAELSAQTQLQAEMVLRELAAVAFADPGKYLTWSPFGVRMKSSNELTPFERKAVREVRESSSDHSSTTSIKFHDKVRALELLGKHIGLFPERHQIENGAEDFTVTLQPKPWREVMAGMLDTGTAEEKTG